MLNLLNRILKLTELSMEGQRCCVFSGIAYGEQCGNGEIFGQAQGAGNIVCIEIAHPAGSDSQLKSLEHHVGADNGCIGLTGLITGLQLVLPIPVAVIAHHRITGASKVQRQTDASFFLASSLLATKIFWGWLLQAVGATRPASRIRFISSSLMGSSLKERTE